MMQIKRLQQIAYKYSKSQGFWDDQTVSFSSKIALIHSELSEALEADRKDLMDDKVTDRHGTEVELADAMIRICDLAEAYGLDLEGAIEDKMVYNSTRTKKHGVKY